MGPVYIISKPIQTAAATIQYTLYIIIYNIYNF